MLLRGEIKLFDVDEVNQRIVNCPKRFTKDGIDVPMCKKVKLKCCEVIDNGQCEIIKKYMDEKYARNKDKVVLESVGVGIYDK